MKLSNPAFIGFAVGFICGVCSVFIFSSVFDSTGGFGQAACGTWKPPVVSSSSNDADSDKKKYEGWSKTSPEWINEPKEIFRETRPGARGEAIMNTMRTIANTHGSKFVSDKFWFHDYAAAYEKVLAPYVANPNKPFKYLEIGVAPKANGHMFISTYAPNVDYFGLDIEKFDWYKNLPETQKNRADFLTKRIFLGSQANDKDLADMTARGPFDVIIDDGSHWNEHIPYSFYKLFPAALKPGGVYCIEDLSSAYFLPAKEDLRKRTDAVNWIAELVIQLQFPFHWPSKGIGMHKKVTFPVKKVAEMIRSIDCDREVCCFTKMDNPDGRHKFKVPCKETEDTCPWPEDYISS